MNSIPLAFGALDARLATQCRALSLRRHEVPVRIGVPKQNGGLAEAVATPAHSTGVGLLYYGARQLKNAAKEGKSRKGSIGVGEGLRSVWAWLKNYV